MPNAAAAVSAVPVVTTFQPSRPLESWSRLDMRRAKEYGCSISVEPVITKPRSVVAETMAAATIAGSSRGRSRDSMVQISGRSPLTSDQPQASARKTKSRRASSQMRAMFFQ